MLLAAATMTLMAIDFTLSPELEDIRLRVRTFIDDVVKPGETLWSIAQSRYGNPGAWRRIAEVNRIDNPSRVRPGTTVYLPSADELQNGAR